MLFDDRHNFSYALYRIIIAQRIKFSIKDFFSNPDQIRSLVIFTEKILIKKLKFCTG